MRLLNSKTLELKSFVHQNVSHYVILSHTWGEEEVTFEDLRSGKYENMKGYSKLKGACDQAIRDGYDWIWVDTCSIDKYSSAELQESINSMYSWYQRAHICYAYLEDVPDYESGW
jgi:hypothetical protein